MNLLVTEMRRALHRRAVRVLIAIALFGCVLTGVIAFVSSAGKTTLQLRLEEGGHPAVMTDWWIPGASEGMLSIAMFFLFLGAFFGGATVAGGEWRAGTVATVLTWEPRRLRLHAARSASATVLALGISFVLQVIFLTAFVPAVLANGTTDGVDGSFWWGLLGAMGRTSLLSAAAALLAVALATVARNTAFAVIAMFTWLMVVEGLIRGLRPSWAEWLWAENLGTVMAWARLDADGLQRGPLTATATLLVYVAIIVVLAGTSFQHRDISAAS